MSKTEDVVKNLKFLPTKSKNCVGFILADYANGDSWSQIVVVYNGNNTSVEMKIPEGQWTVVGFDGEINNNGISTKSGGTITIPAVSAFIAHR